MRKGVLVIAVLVLLSLSGIAQAVTIDTVTVGDPGNAADTTGYGAVAYNYDIGKYEVTAGQYTEIHNTVAATDPYGLYSADMAHTGYGSGITRSGSSGSYSYSVAEAFVNRPVDFVNFWDACRFANWLSTGNTETGAYTLTAEGITNNTITRNLGWTGWAVTSEDEWYKAAYYKGGGTAADYWDYPTSSNSVPGQDMADLSGNNANFYTDPYTYPIDSGKYTTVVGEFQNSDSPYGTFDQGGNVWEWNESIIGANRCRRGGALGTSAYEGLLLASARDSISPTNEHFTGFRVSRITPVPEPSSLIALAGGIASLLAFRRRRA